MMLLVVLSLVLFPFLTYYISTNLFYRRIDSKKAGKSPPTIPYLLPGVFHFFNLAYLGPQRYFAAVLKDYGRFSPFLVKTGTRSFAVLRDPYHVKKAIELTASNYKGVDALTSAFEVPHATPSFASETDKRSIEDARTVLPRKYLTGASLYQLTDKYASTLSNQMHDKMFQHDTWTLIEDFGSFFQQVITKCTVQTLLGSSFAKQYPAFVKDFWEYDRAVHAFMPGMPWGLSSTIHEAPRQRLLQGIESWLRTNHSGSEFSRLGTDDPVVDEFKGSKFVQETDDIFAKMDGSSLEARAAELLAIMHSSISTSVASGFWTIVEIMRRPNLAKHLETEITKYYLSHPRRPNLAGIASIPILQSIHTEVERLRIARRLVRYVDGPGCQLDKMWTIPRGSYAIAFSLDIALNTDMWAKAQPRASQKPLQEFWAERFLVDTKQSMKANLPSGKFELDDLEPIVVALRGDQYARLGREFTSSIQAAILAVFLTEFELQMDDPEIIDSATPSAEESAYGTGNLVANVPVRIRKLKLNKSR